MQDIRQRQEFWALLFTVFVIVMSNASTAFAQNQEQSESETVPEGFALSANTNNGQTLVNIVKEFSTDTVSLESMIEQIKEMFSISRGDADLLLTVSENNVELDEEFDVNINSKQCVSQISELSFVAETTDREKILDAIVERTQLSDRVIQNSLDFEIDVIDISVRVQEGKARVQVEYCDEKMRFVVGSSDQAEIISDISKKTGLREHKIPLIWSYTTDVVPEKKRLSLEEQKELALKYGEGVFENAAQQMEKVESAQKVVAEGGEDPVTSGTGGGCLIATATFGSELSPQVQMLREIRDDAVLNTSSGATFMTTFNTFYYSFSPAVADLERQNPVFKEMVKIAITPLISSLSLLQYADIDSEEEMLGYGIGIILLNVGMYFVLPIVGMMKLNEKVIKKTVTRGFY